MPAPTPLAFISYRRTDSSAAARWLASSMARTFGPQSVFIDTESIRLADDWPQRIDDALAAATVLVPVIGPRWLSSADADFRRRIDRDGDWVRNEIRHALDAKLRILPVLLSRTPMPEAKALPEAIARLARHQAFELRDERWESDLALLLAGMEPLGFRRLQSAAVRYPSPLVTLRELGAAELRQALASLPQWSCVVSDLPGTAGGQRTELHRAYEFATFADAIGFMNAAVPKIDALQHHPRWENVWRTVSVWLSTWDIGHQPSELDLELAAYLDGLRGQFAAARGRRGRPS
jgi:pterin-4a-carbinolamine dehydratase